MSYYMSYFLLVPSQSGLRLVSSQIKQIHDTPWAKWRENCGFTDGMCSHNIALS